jgi:hypothetical protein
MANPNTWSGTSRKAWADRRERTVTARWVEEVATDAYSKRISRHLDRLIESMIETAAQRQGKDDVLGVNGTVSDSDHPDQRVNSL